MLAFSSCLKPHMARRQIGQQVIVGVHFCPMMAEAKSAFSLKKTPSIAASVPLLAFVHYLPASTASAPRSAGILPAGSASIPACRPILRPTLRASRFALPALRFALPASRFALSPFQRVSVSGRGRSLTLHIRDHSRPKPGLRKPGGVRRAGLSIPSAGDGQGTEKRTS